MKLQNNKSSNEILLQIKANALSFILKIKKNVNFKLNLADFLVF